MLAAVSATDKRLIAPSHFMQICAHIPFSYIKSVLFRCKTLVAIYWIHFKMNLSCIKYFCPQNKQNGILFLTGQFQWQRRHAAYHNKH